MSNKPAQPELKKYIDKRMFLNLQAGRKVTGILRGYDIFLNLVLDDAQDETVTGEKVAMGTVVIRDIFKISDASGFHFNEP